MCEGGLVGVAKGGSNMSSPVPAQLRGCPNLVDALSTAECHDVTALFMLFPWLFLVGVTTSGSGFGSM